MNDSRAQVSSWVDGVAGGTTERSTDTDNEKSYRESAEGSKSAARVLATESDNDEYQNESADDLSYKVPAVAANRGTGGEDSELRASIRHIVKVLLVGKPREDGTDDCTEQLGGDVREHRTDGHSDTETEFGSSAGYKSERDGRVDVRSRVVRDDHTGKDGETPTEVDHEEAAVEALVFSEGYVGYDTRTQEDQEGSIPTSSDRNIAPRLSTLTVLISSDVVCATLFYGSFSTIEKVVSFACY